MPTLEAIFLRLIFFSILGTIDFFLLIGGYGILRGLRIPVNWIIGTLLKEYHGNIYVFNVTRIWTCQPDTRHRAGTREPWSRRDLLPSRGVSRDRRGHRSRISPL